MKRIILSLLVACAATLSTQAYQQDALAGAWQTQQGDVIQTAVFVDGYLSHSTYDLKNKKFISTRGGTYTTDGKTLTVTWQYDTDKAASNVAADTWVGQSGTFDVTPGNTLSTNLSGASASWQRIDSNEGPMAGVWRITGRKQGDEMGQMPLRDRRTLKILSGTRFQWVAINIKTGEFSGTGGGTYTFENGKYTENIEFFSRDNSRVGASLSFDGKIENGSWHHSGLSSAGDPIYEIWDKLEE
ncbi:hypothetical protein GCM10011386_22450 [Parapedobacter defluvii]|uniref:Membrane or secreted protein n=1 Tax=Parapedobacter defluvii TaxID=2045106 RepID=A0ABQ1LV20_9SPHI|nr:membrane or secreted protein [Parapedobacter defluvii]RQP15451.1 MAG: membrane or secreted protein [Parapedobacter sp.]GGC29931.1 hypothetical protein GCM10011386_22450 [Parapedobacter defluvii]